MNKQISRVWGFASDSNPNIEFETLEYTDGTTSCNCMGWTRRVVADGSRRAQWFLGRGIPVPALWFRANGLDRSAVGCLQQSGR